MSTRADSEGWSEVPSSSAAGGRKKLVLAKRTVPLPDDKPATPASGGARVEAAAPAPAPAPAPASKPADAPAPAPSFRSFDGMGEGRGSGSAFRRDGARDSPRGDGARDGARGDAPRRDFSAFGRKDDRGDRPAGDRPAGDRFADRGDRPAAGGGPRKYTPRGDATAAPAPAPEPAGPSRFQVAAAALKESSERDREMRESHALERGDRPAHSGPPAGGSFRTFAGGDAPSDGGAPAGNRFSRFSSNGSRGAGGMYSRPVEMPAAFQMGRSRDHDGEGMGGERPGGFRQLPGFDSGRREGGGGPFAGRREGGGGGGTEAGDITERRHREMAARFEGGGGGGGSSAFGSRFNRDREGGGGRGGWDTVGPYNGRRFPRHEAHDAEALKHHPTFKNRYIADPATAGKGTALDHPEKHFAADVPIATPDVTAALTHAKEMLGDDVVVTTMLHGLRKVIDALLNGGYGGKTGAGELTEELRKLTAATDYLPAAAVCELAETAFDCERKGDRELLASVINLLRQRTPVPAQKGKATPEPLPLVDDEQAAHGLHEAVTRFDESCSEEPTEAEVDAAIRLRHLIDAVTKVAPFGTKAAGGAKGGAGGGKKKAEAAAGAEIAPSLPVEALSSDTQDFLASGPIEKPVEAAAAEDAAATAAAGGAGASSSSSSEAPAESATSIAVSEVRKAAAASTGAPLVAGASARAADEVAKELVESGLTGRELALETIKSFAGCAPRAAARQLVSAIAWHLHSTNAFTVAAAWTHPEEYGMAIAALTQSSTGSIRLDVAVSAILAIQEFVNSASVPKHAVSNTLAKFYELDIVDEDSLLAWRDDTTDPTPGKDKMIKETTEFFKALTEAEEEEEEESEEVKAAMAGYERPNNRSKVR